MAMRIRDPVPEVAIPMHDRESLHELDEGAERRQQRRDQAGCARKGRDGEPGQGVERDEMLALSQGTSCTALCGGITAL